MKKRRGIPYLTRKSKLRIASALVLVPVLVVLVYYVSDYRAINSAFDLITQSDAQWNCVNYEAQFYVSEECRIEGSIVIDGNTAPLWIGYRPSYAELYACDANTVSQPDSNNFLIAKTRFRAYNGRLHFVFIEDVAGLGIDKLVFEEAD